MRHFNHSSASINNGHYRYGFQGQETDDEIKGKGNSVNYKYRMHDPRVGRFFAVDPLASKYPHNSPYAFSENRVIDAIELEGLETFTLKEHSIYNDVIILMVTKADTEFKVIDEQGNVMGDFKYKSIEYQMDGWEPLPGGGIRVPNFKKKYKGDPNSFSAPKIEFANPENTFSTHNYKDMGLNDYENVEIFYDDEDPNFIYERISQSDKAIVKSYLVPESSSDVKYDFTLNNMLIESQGANKEYTDITVSFYNDAGDLIMSGGIDDNYEFSLKPNTSFSVEIKFGKNANTDSDISINSSVITTEKRVAND